ncbi:MAG TPA: hypothetical protein EYP98_09140 [Planctomycetes bacterium]|nr:hypothetical protein [Planctomycetota bacterium]
MTSIPETTALQRRHLRIGWGSLLLFVVLGGVLESMHGFKVDWYLAVGNETQRLLWRLAHAHGTFLSLVHIGFAVTLSHMGSAPPKLAAACLTGALIALPGGFLLGAFGGHGGDPGLGILLVPVGLLLLVVAIVATLRNLRD